MKTKIYLFILTLLLSVGNAWAAATTLATGEVASGSISETINWEVTKDEKSIVYLNLTGTGELPSDMITPPWANCTVRVEEGRHEKNQDNYDLRSDIKWVLIDSRISSVNNTILGGLTNLNTIRFKNGSSVTTESNYCKVEDGVLYQNNPITQGSTPTRKLVIYPATKIGTEFVVPNNVTMIDVNAFNENKNLQSLYIKGDISSIGAGAFNNCSNLSLIHFDKDYKGNYAWSRMASEGKFITASRANLTRIEREKYISAPSGWEERSHYKTVLLDNGYASLHNGNLYIYGPQRTTYKVSTFNQSEADNYIWNSAKSEITSLTIGKGITGIDEAALSGGNYTSLTTITVEDGNTNFFVIDDNKVLLNNDKTKLILYAQGNAATKYTVPGTISVIGEGAFMGAQNLTEVEMTSIGTLSKNAFNGCSNLSRIRVFNSVAAPYIGVDALKNLAWKGVLTYRGNHNSFDTMLATINTRNAGNEATAQWTRGYYYICNNGNTGILEDGVLTVSGNQPLSGNEWANEKNLITTVVIGEEIPSVGDNAFENYVALKNLYLYGGGVIGSEAFKKCTALQKITIGSNVSSFHNYKTPSGIVYTSFDGCGNIQTIDINDIAAWCKIQNKDQLFNADKASGYTLMLNGEVFDGTTHLVIPEAVTTVGSSFKYFSNVKYIELPKNKERLENYEFEDYKYLHFLYLPSNLKTIGAEACRGCSSLIALTIPASVETISDGAFSGCSGITKLFLNGGREIKEHAFKGCSALKEITISSKVKSFFTYTSGFYDTFEGCDNIETIDIENITDWCNLQNKEQLFKANKPEGYTLKIEGDSPANGWTINIPSSITNVGSSFKYFNNVQKIILLEGRVSIANGEFRDYKYLQTLILPSSLKTIGMSACNGCSSLRTVEIPSSVENIQRGAFSGCSSLQSLYLLGGGTIDPEAFKNCTELSEITIGSKVKSFYYPGAIQQATFEGCNNIHTIDVLDLEAWCKIEKKDQLFHYNGHDYYLMYQSKELADNNTRLNIPADITYVGSSFKYFKNVEHITLDGRVSIADNEFSGYTYLKMLTLDIGLKVIGSNAFLGCTSLQRITIPQTVDIIKNSAFRGCTSMNELSLQGGGTIGQEAFGGCTALRKVIIDHISSLYFDGYLAHSPFNQCDNIEEVHVRDLLLYCKIKNIRALTEAGKTGKLLYMGSPVGETTTTINVPGGVTDIEYHAFYNYGNTDLTEVILPPTVATIGNLAFYGAPNINVVRSYATEVPTTNSPLITNPGSATLYVPTGTRSAYAAHPIWKDFGNIEEFDTPQLNKYRINAPIGTSTHELTMEGTTIKQVDSSDETIAWWQDGMVYTRGSYYTGQGKYVEKEAVLTVTGDNGAVSYCVVNVAPKAQLTDGQAYTNPEDVEMESVVYTRNFGTTEKWQQLYVPFSMSYNDWNSQELDVARINAYYEYDDDEDGVIDRHVLQVMKVSEANGALRPNHPYLVRAREAGSKRFEVTNTTLNKADENSIECSTTETRYVFTGTYQPIDGMKTKGYYFLSGGKMMTADNDELTMSPYRWYLRRESKDGQFLANDNDAPAFISIRVIGEDFDETSIEVIDEDMFNETTYIYNLNGQKVSEGDMSNLPAGVYIRNNKKIYIK